MKILLIGNGSDIFAKELSGELKINSCEVMFLNTSSLQLILNDGTICDKYANYFCKYKKIPKFNVFIKFFLIRKIIVENNFDVINILGSSWQYILLLNFFKKMNAKLVITFYGSDFYRTSNRVKNIQIPLYTYADALTFTNPLTKASFLQYYKSFQQKSFVCRFGLKTLDYIDKNRLINKKDIRKHLKYKQDKIIVTCGYNSTNEQQQEKIIQSIKSLDKNILDKIQFIFPLTYGDNVHKEYIKKILKQNEFDYIILEEYLYADENAYIKLASDIMINILKTDSFSGSMQEFLYADNIVITGEWLPYDIFDSEGIQYEKIKNDKELSDKIEYCISLFDTLKKDLDKNRDIIKKLSSWEVNIQKWIDVYKLNIKDTK
jgi:glycosyltransferase involved in cell wall biosynthesis